MGVFFFIVGIFEIMISLMVVLLERYVNNLLLNKVISMFLDFDDDRRFLMDMVSFIFGCVWNLIGVVDLFFLFFVF